MWFAVLSGLIVSVDALFIGVSLGTQKKCRLWHLVVINILLTALCFAGYGLGILIGNYLDIELDAVIGTLFILLGLWLMLYYFVIERKKAAALPPPTTTDTTPSKQPTTPPRNVIITGVLMGIEAMLITIGLTLVLPHRTALIPVTVAVAHLVYSIVTYSLSRHLRRLPPALGHIISAVALIAYGIMALII